jgi:hypothetical protein
MWSIHNPQVQAAIICLIVATVYLFMWPGRKNPNPQWSVWTRLVLRWFHSLTWILIAAACLLWSKIPAIAAFCVYLIFLITTMRVRKAANR